MQLSLPHVSKNVWLISNLMYCEVTYSFRLATQARQKIVQYVTKGNISHSATIMIAQTFNNFFLKLFDRSHSQCNHMIDSFHQHEKDGIANMVAQQLPRAG